MSSSDKFFTFIRGLSVFTALPDFSTQQMSQFLQNLIRQGPALVYDDILFMSNFKPHMLQLMMQQIHVIAKKEKLKVLSSKSSSCFSL